MSLDMDEVRRQVTGRAAKWADEDVAVRVEQTVRHPVHVVRLEQERVRMSLAEQALRVD